MRKFVYTLSLSAFTMGVFLGTHLSIEPNANHMQAEVAGKHQQKALEKLMAQK